MSLLMAFSEISCQPASKLMFGCGFGVAIVEGFFARDGSSAGDVSGARFLLDLGIFEPEEGGYARAALPRCCAKVKHRHFTLVLVMG